MKHQRSGRRLHSHAIRLEHGTKNQEVSACLGEDVNPDYDYWIICAHELRLTEDGELVGFCPIGSQK